MFSFISLPVRTYLSATILLSANLLVTSAQADEAGKAVFDDVCSSCHNGGFRGFVSGAPRAGDDSAWEDKIQGGLDQAVMDVLQGTENHKSMREKENLDKQDVYNAVLYIVSITSELKKRINTSVHAGE